MVLSISPALPLVLPVPEMEPPGSRTEWVERPALLDRLSTAGYARLLLIDAPAGYGKTTLLRQWARREQGRTFVWLSLEPEDGDPLRLLARLSNSLATTGRAAPLPGLAALDEWSAEAAVAQVVCEIERQPMPVVLVLDDYQVLMGQEAHELVGRLIAELPARAQIALGTRTDPPLQLARMRVAGELCEVRAADLKFDAEAADALLERMGITLGADQIETLVHHAEGWAAGLHLAALSLKDQPEPQDFLDTFAGSHRNIADYLAEEVLAHQPDEVREFLLRTSVLGSLSSQLCDAVLGTHNAQSVLEFLERSNMFVVGLDETRDWFRYHHLFAEMLQTELARTQPAMTERIHRRASRWFGTVGRFDEAVDHAIAGGDLAGASALIADRWLSSFNLGTVAKVRSWLDQIGGDAVGADAAAALTAAWVAALSNDTEQTDYFLELAESLPHQEFRARWIEGRAALVRGLFSDAGLEYRRSQLVRANALQPPGSSWRPFISWALGHVSLMAGAAADAVEYFRGAGQPQVSEQPVLAMIMLAEHAVAEVELGHLPSAERKAQEALALAETQGLLADARSAAAFIALSRVAVARGDLVEGRTWFEGALRGSAGPPSPWPTAELLPTLVPARYQQGPGALGGRLVDDVRARLPEISAVREVGFGQRLTERELLVLGMLESHLTSREIGDELCLSINTVKTHTRSIYRKLGVTSRRSALERAGGLQLI